MVRAARRSTPSPAANEAPMHLVIVTTAVARPPDDDRTLSVIKGTM